MKTKPRFKNAPSAAKPRRDARRERRDVAAERKSAPTGGSGRGGDDEAERVAEPGG